MDTFEIVGLDHVVLACADVERSLAWYCGELGLEPVRVEEWRRGEVPFPSVRVDATTIIDLFARPPDGANMDHLCLVCASLDADAVAERFPGARTAHGLFGAQGYATSVYVADPDGNTVELRSYD